MASPEEGLAQLDATHAIELKYFGARVTEELFGQDEATQRELLTLMSLGPGPGSDAGAARRSGTGAL
jgi:hypothetical protein